MPGFESIINTISLIERDLHQISVCLNEMTILLECNRLCPSVASRKGLYIGWESHHIDIYGRTAAILLYALFLDESAINLTKLINRLSSAPSSDIPFQSREFKLLVLPKLKTILENDKAENPKDYDELGKTRDRFAAHVDNINTRVYDYPPDCALGLREMKRLLKLAESVFYPILKFVVGKEYQSVTGVSLAESLIYSD